MIKYTDFKKIFNTISGEPEITLYFKNIDDTYMIIKYEKYVTFQKCCDSLDRGEIKYNSLDELYNTVLIDDIFLKRDWHNISDILIDEAFSVIDDFDDIIKAYNVNL